MKDHLLEKIFIIFQIIGAVIFTVFLVLKLANVILWNWFFIILPLWLPIAFFGGLLLIIIIAICILTEGITR
jgi:hypothetical protein